MPEVQEGLAALRIDRVKRKRRRVLWPWLLLAALIAVVALAPQITNAVLGVEVSAAAVQSTGKDGGELSAAGYIVADRQSVLAFKGTGRLIKLNVVESQQVKEGELIAEIDHKELDATIERMKADVAESRAEVERLRQAVKQAETEIVSARAPLETTDAEIAEMRVRWADAKRKMDRDRKVAQSDAIPFSAVEDHEFGMKLAEAQIKTAEKRKQETQHRIEVMTAQAAVAKRAVEVAEAHANTMAAHVRVMETQRLDSFVYSPFDGVVTEKAAELGEIVAPISIGGSMARGSIVTIAEWNSLQAEVDVAEAYIGRVKSGQRAAITVDAIPGKIFAGRVKRILPRANRSKATVQVRIEFLDPHEGVLPEMGVRVRFLSDDAPKGSEKEAPKEKLTIPRAAVQSAGKDSFVWVVENDKVAKKRPITAIDATVDPVEIASGLARGEKVVTRGAEKISQDAQKVRVTQ